MVRRETVTALWGAVTGGAARLIGLALLSAAALPRTICRLNGNVQHGLSITHFHGKYLPAVPIGSVTQTLSWRAKQQSTFISSRVASPASARRFFAASTCVLFSTSTPR